MNGRLLARYPLFRLLSPRQLDDWLAAGQEIDCLSGFVLFQENTKPAPGSTSSAPAGCASCASRAGGS